MSENTIHTDDFDKSIYNLRWFQLPSDEKLLNKHVVLRVDRNHTDPVNTEMVNKIQSAYSNTYGSGVNPIAVPDLLKAAIWALNALEFVGEPDASKALEAAIDKAKLI